jgi:plastocyanin
MGKQIIALGLLAAFLGVGPTNAGTITGKVEAKKAKYVPNTVVYLEGVAGEFPPPEKPVVMDQQNLVFVPHVLPVLAGTTVSFHNSDEVQHNVFTPDECAGEFNLGSWGKDGSKDQVFKSPGCTAVMLCNVHPEMEAYVVVLENPYYGITDEEGSFRIEGVPAGTYQMRAWNKRLKADSQEITVGDEDTVEVALALKR